MTIKQFSPFKGLVSEGAKVVPLLIRFMTPAGEYMVQRSNDCFNKVIISSLHGVIKRPLKDNRPISLFF